MRVIVFVSREVNKVYVKCEKNMRKLFIVCIGFVLFCFGIYGELVFLIN